ncbi:GntR family transcriptional regulator [Streptomyces gelaticus]|nr:GntR family transcriptional regulator [Streptomyces gelaticus]
MTQGVVRRLKQLILERGLGPRDALPAGAEPMELFGAGRTAVREALDDGHQDPLAGCARHYEIVATAATAATADGERAVRVMCTNFDGIRARL